MIGCLTEKEVVGTFHWTGFIATIGDAVCFSLMDHTVQLYFWERRLRIWGRATLSN